MGCTIALPNESWTSLVIDADRLVLPDGDWRLDALLALCGTTVLHRSSGICIVEYRNESSDVPWRKGMSGWKRMFERTYMHADESNRVASNVISGFFDWLGVEYTHEIDHDRNKRCYEELFSIAQRHRGNAPCSTLLDLGCGPATILESEVRHFVDKIAGYDLAPTVRALAAAAGLRVLDDNTFRNGSERFDIVLSAYVVHYGCDLAATAKRVAAAIGDDGVWVMNFHKGLNLQSFRSALSFWGMREVGDPINSMFGPILTVVPHG